MDFDNITFRRPGRPRKAVVDQHIEKKDESDITHIIGHNSVGGAGGVGDPSDSVSKDNNNPSPIPTAENKKVPIVHDSGTTTTMTLNGSIERFERLMKYVEGKDMDEKERCVCWHCRTYSARFKEEMRKALGNDFRIGQE